MIIYLPSQWCKVAEMSLSYSLLLWLFMKYSSPALIQTEQRGHDKKKNLTKLVANQNMPALPLSDDL